MVRNNFQKDFNELCLVKNAKKMDIAKACGKMPSAVSRDMRLEVINRSFVQYLEYLGYDIEVSYVER